MADTDGDERPTPGAATGEPAPEAGDVHPVAVFADTMPAPVPSIADGHPVELGVPQEPRPRLIDRVLGAVLGKAVSAMNCGRDRVFP
jgi:hypothetical protein